MARQAGPKTTFVTCRLDSDLVRSMREVGKAARMTRTAIIDAALRQWLVRYIHANKVAADEMRSVAR